MLDSGHELGVVISQPDTRKGRGRKLSKPPVAELANTAGVPLLQPDRIGEVARRIEEYDALVVAAYGQILRPDTLYAAELGAWNVHASLLPAYRGAAPIERAIMESEEKTGVSIMLMDEGLDTGPVALRKSIPISPDANAGDITSALARLGAKAIVEALSLVENDNLTLSKQDESEATYAAKIAAPDRIVRWDLPARRIRDQIRALAPGIGARTFHPAFDGPVKLLRARIAEGNLDLPLGLPSGSISAAKGCIRVRCGDGALSVEKLQVPGGKPVGAGEFLRGNKLEGAFTGYRL